MGAGAEGEQRLAQQRHPAIADAVDLDHLEGEVLRLGDVLHPEALESRQAPRVDLSLLIESRLLMRSNILKVPVNRNLEELCYAEKLF